MIELDMHDEGGWAEINFSTEAEISSVLKIYRFGMLLY